PPGREPLLREPEALAIIGQDPDRLRAPAPEDEDRTGEGVRGEYRSAHCHEAIDPLPEVDRLDGDEDAHLSGELDHAPSVGKRRAPPPARATRGCGRARRGSRATPRSGEARRRGEGEAGDRRASSAGLLSEGRGQLTIPGSSAHFMQPCRKDTSFLSPPLSAQPCALTRRHWGAPRAASGSPPERSTWSWCAARALDASPSFPSGQ